MSIEDYIVGDTLKATWVNSTNTPSDIHCAVYNGDEALVDSATMIDSGDGSHYYHLHTVPDTPGWYAVKITGVISGKPYKRGHKYRAILDEVD